MLDSLRKFNDLLDSRERRNAIILFFMILITGILEAVGVGSLMPFLSVLSNPETVQENVYLAYAYQAFDFSDTDSFLLFLGSGVFCVVVFGLSFKALTQYALARFTHMRNYSLSTRLLRGYLARPYSWFLNRHSADLGKTLLSEVQQVISQALIPTAQFIAQSVIALCLLGMVLLMDPLMALMAATLLGGAYALIYAALRTYLQRIGADRVRANQERFQIAQEALGGIKEVKAAGLEAGYLAGFRKPAYRFARHQAGNMIAGQVPRFALEGLAVGGMLAVILVLLVTRDGDLGQVLPTIGVFAFAGMRLLPALQQVYQNATKLRFGKPALDALHADLVQTQLDAQSKSRLNQAKKMPTLSLCHGLDLVEIEFWYPGADRPALQNLSLHIPAKSTVGIVGATGAGKTTAVDVILGLLVPNGGDLQVDGTSINENNVTSWQRKLGYVPQQIFLVDDSVTSNIAFGVPQEEVDQVAVERAARIAELHDFVIQEMPQGYDTLVGERGIRLSGGQRQRIGIARALYHDPDVLILDEATSALDNFTEKAVMQAVHNLSNKKTIILIAHRLSTVQNCNCIYLFDHGRLAAQGTYWELLETNQDFQRLAAVND